MTLNEFVQRWNGQYDDFDNYASTQCKDTFSRYNRDVVGNPNYVLGDAWELYAKAPDSYYEKIRNTASFIPRAGDVCVWDKSYGGYGHVAICLDGCTANSLRVLGQNYPVTSKQNADGSWTKGSPNQIVTMSYNKVYGFLRPKENMDLLAELNNCKSNLTLNEKAVKELDAKYTELSIYYTDTRTQLEKVNKSYEELDTDFDTYREDSADKIDELGETIKKNKEQAILDLATKQKKIDDLEQAIKDKDISKLSFWQKVALLFT